MIALFHSLIAGYGPVRQNSGFTARGKRLLSGHANTKIDRTFGTVESTERDKTGLLHTVS